MSPGPVIETFDVIKGATSGLSPCLKRLAINTFTLEAMKEAFHGRIIVAIGSPAHASSHAFVLQKCLIAFTRIGTPSIRVMEESEMTDGDESRPSGELVPPGVHPGSQPLTRRAPMREKKSSTRC